MDIIESILKSYEMFLIVLIRTSGVFLLSPLFSSDNVPNTFKIGFTVFLSAILAGSLPIEIVNANIPSVILVVSELTVGIIIGFMAYLFFTAFYVMGQVIDMNIGFGMANVIDPQNRVQVPLTGNFYYILAFLTLLMLNGHHKVIEALVRSYKLIPIGGFSYTEDIFRIILLSMTESFKIGFKLSLPIIAIIFTTDIILGILARTMPQMNVFVVGMPLKLLIGLFMLLMGMPVFFGGLENILELIVEYIDEFLMLGAG